MTKIKSSEITPEHIYLSRRKFMVGIGALAASSAVLTACGGLDNASVPESPASSGEVEAELEVVETGGQTDELGDETTSFEAITNFNNFYEFTTDKEGVAGLSQGFKTSPWSVDVGGLVNNPKTYDIDDLRTKFAQEERIYRLRCVEGWSMVIPWMGFPLAEILKEVEPTAKAKYVRFESVYKPEELPGQKSAWYTWPYIEGLRLDEAMNNLTLAATGLYGEHLLPQNGAPFRLVVPWKYPMSTVFSLM
jgi:sulfoxide reductase catalytic subunit YedY